MNAERRIAKNTILLAVTSAINVSVGLLLTMYVARYLGADGYGVLSFALALAAIFGILPDIGLNTLAVREVARDKGLAGKYLGNLGILKTVLAIAAFGLTALIANLMGSPSQTVYVIYLIVLSVILNAFSLTFYSVFQAYEQMEYVMVGQILEGLVRLTGAILVINQGLGIMALAFSYVVGNAVALGFNFIVSACKFARPQVKIDLLFWKETIQKAWPFGLALVFSTIIYWIGSVMISSMKGSEAVGWYTAAYRPTVLFSLLASAYCGSIFPVMSKFNVSAKESLRFAYERSVKYMVILALPIGVGTTLLASKVILFIYGDHFLPATFSLQILMWSLVFIFISRVFVQLFNALGKQVIVAWVAGICCVFNVVMNLVLIPKYSYVGASVSTVVTEFIFLALCIISSNRIGYGVPVKKLSIVAGQAAGASTVMGIYILYSGNLPLWMLISSSFILYVVALVIFRGVDKADVHIIRRIIGRAQQ